VDDVSFEIHKCKTLGLVGESGSGKTTVGRSILRLAPVTQGEIYYDGKEIVSMEKRPFFPYRKKIQMIFQDPFNSLNPRMKVEDIISEPLEIHFKKLSRLDRQKRIFNLLDKVELSKDSMMRYPHEFSGGQRQRIGIARALAVEPDFIVCDEAVSALDVSVQAQVVNLLQDLQAELGLTYLFIAHDLAVVQHISDSIAVMNKGKIVEQGPSDEICQNPKQAYTQNLLDAAPIL
jgi:peptide/nickel transport system ATP-binding protein/oligopeptide transport system ATP-binding protein